MARFRSRYLTADAPLHRAQDISLERYSCVFIGSDQVWNPDITIGLDDAYIGNIPKQGSCRLVAYAASMGGANLPVEIREKFSASVGTAFASISLREQSAIPFMEELLGRTITSMLDPVLLLERREWEKIAVLPEDEGYVLVYLTEYSPQLMEQAHRVAQQLKKTVISVNFYRRDTLTPEWVERRVDIGPAEFVGYIRNAACVMTNSFHGTAFSILFEKPFAVFPHSTRNARIEDLLKKLGLSTKLVTENIPFTNEIIWASANWLEVSGSLAAERERSMRFIRDNINGRT